MQHMWQHSGDSVASSTGQINTSLLVTSSANVCHEVDVITSYPDSTLSVCHSSAVKQGL